MTQNDRAFKKHSSFKRWKAISDPFDTFHDCISKSFTVVLMLFYVLESVFPNTFRLCLIVSEFKRDVYIFFV